MRCFYREKILSKKPSLQSKYFSRNRCELTVLNSLPSENFGFYSIQRRTFCHICECGSCVCVCVTDVDKKPVATGWECRRTKEVVRTLCTRTLKHDSGSREKQFDMYFDSDRELSANWIDSCWKYGSNSTKKVGNRKSRDSPRKRSLVRVEITVDVHGATATPGFPTD